jgi:uncharacterized protein (DUF1501 family)
MFTRRQMLTRTLQGSSLLALGTAVPEFIAGTARAADPTKARDTVLVVVEMAGGNDGLNTVIPYADDLYQKARPTLRFSKEQVVKLDDHVGLHPAMRPFERLFKDGHLAVVQGVGYPNPDRSHFESMDVWHSADPRRKQTTGWLGRGAEELRDKRGGIPLLSIAGKRLPLALKGASGAAVSLGDPQAYRLELGGGSTARHKARRGLIEDLARTDDKDDLLGFVQRRLLHTLTTVDRLQEVLRNTQGSQGYFSRESARYYGQGTLPAKLELIARLIGQRLGTRVFFVSIDGFDTHAFQGAAHRKLLAEVADGITHFFDLLKQTKNEKRVRLLTFSEFGRRVKENGSKGTDHGAGSCLFVAGGSLKGGVVGKHPSLADLDSGDLKHHTDFRRVYATLLDAWLGVDSRAVLGAKFEHVAGLV